MLLSIGEVNEMRIIMLFLFGCLNVVVGLLFWWGAIDCLPAHTFNS